MNPEHMRIFEDVDGRRWVARVRERPGPDYKGRYHLYLEPEDGEQGEGVALLDIRWNSARTARRTMETMSDVELRRRLRQAVGRSPTGPVPRSAE